MKVWRRLHMYFAMKLAFSSAPWRHLRTAAQRSRGDSLLELLRKRRAVASLDDHTSVLAVKDIAEQLLFILIDEANNLQATQFESIEPANIEMVRQSLKPFEMNEIAKDDNDKRLFGGALFARDADLSLIEQTRSIESFQQQSGIGLWLGVVQDKAKTFSQPLELFVDSVIDLIAKMLNKK